MNSREWVINESGTYCWQNTLFGVRAVTFTHVPRRVRDCFCTYTCERVQEHADGTCRPMFPPAQGPRSKATAAVIGAVVWGTLALGAVIK